MATKNNKKTSTKISKNTRNNIAPATTRRMVSAPIARSVQTFSRGNPLVVKHREQVAQVTLTDIDTVMSYVATPGSAGPFPWLSKIANNYDLYKFISLVYEYIPSVATTTPGRVIMAFNYDISDQVPTAIELTSTTPSVEGPVYTSLVINVPVDNRERFCGYSLNNGVVTDLTQRILGEIQVGTFGGPNTGATCGELYVSYVVEFRRPSAPKIDWMTYNGITDADGVYTGTATLRGQFFGSTTGRSMFFRHSGTYEVIVTYVVSSATTPVGIDMAVGNGAVLRRDMGRDAVITSADLGPICYVGFVDVVVRDATPFTDLPYMTATRTGTGAFINNIWYVRRVSDSSFIPQID